ncbi:DUF2927 domain-containing protein [Vibrio mangrovi]|uniref:DUF2927 domain-containing protein n=1 Tax=Vibrio mangrovi TaxID=474394 RepID=A0A1Y6IQP7_9VIBR|nr:DUF2927 domain-containing protein [Vibrio mangrovi]MDW6003824.1 DUF2927 domain-containing protein [Vibrio mangrovi]SMR99381.1 hypothetical protein VIM7927_00606 [Vibrio mangrovi]
MYRWQQLCLIFMTVFFSQKTIAELPTWENPRFIQNAFFHVALNHEFASHGKHRLAKWNQPLRIWFQHDVGEQPLHEKLARLHLTQLEQLTHLPFHIVSQRADANFIWYFTRQSLWQKIVREELGATALKNTHGSVCMFGVSVNAATQEITHATVIIPVDQAREHGKLLSCIIEESTQALGLFNDSEQAYPSVFNDRTPDDFLSPLDIILLELLYEPSLRPGMNQKSLEPLLKQLLEQYQQQGKLKQALYQSRHAPLVEQFGN